MRAFARAPVRVDPAGGGTDAPPFCVDHGGKVVNFGVKRHVFARAQRLDPGAGVLIYSRDLRAGVRARNSESLPAEGRLELLQGFVKKLLPPGESLLLVTSSEVPPGSGLGGSGAVGVAVVAALDRLLGVQRSKDDTAAVANEVERMDLGYPGGSQDSYGAARGGLNLLEYHPGGGMTPRAIEVAEATPGPDGAEDVAEARQDPVVLTLAVVRDAVNRIVVAERSVHGERIAPALGATGLEERLGPGGHRIPRDGLRLV